MKKIIGFFLSIAIVFTGSVTICAEGYKSEYLNNLYVSPTVDLGYPLPTTQFIDCTFSKEDGRDVLYTTATGKPAHLVCYDIESRKIIRELPLAGAKVSWSHGTDSKGNVYIATQSEASVFKFDPVTKKLTNYGKVVAPDGVTQTALYGVSFDENDNAYIGTYPSAYVLKVDAKTGEYSFLTNQICPGEKYIRAQTIHDGYFYGGGNDEETCFSRMNLKTGEIESLPVFNLNGEKMSYFNGFTVAGNYMFIHFYTTEKRTLMAIYKIKEKEWILDESKILECNGFYASPEYDGKVYVHNKLTGTMFAFDLATGIYKDTMIPGSTNRQSKWFEFGTEELPGKTLLTVQSNGTVTFFNLEKKTWNNIDTFAAPQPAEIRAMERGPAGTDKIILGMYMGPRLGIVNEISDKVEYLNASQIEGMGEAHGEYYLGTYPGGNIETLDLNNMTRTRIASLQEYGQDRPFSVIEAGDYVAYGTFPDYGKLEGALTLINPKTKEYEVFKNLVHNQTIESLAYRDGKIYGTTSVYGGLGSDPTETSAKMFIFDLATKTKTLEKEIKLKNIEGNVLFAGKTTFAPNGDLWSISKGVMFKINPETLEIIDEVVVKEGQVWDPKTTRAVPYQIHWLNDTVCITTAGDILSIVDVATKEHKQLTQISTGYMAVTDYNNVYFASSNRVKLYKFNISIDGERNFIEDIYNSDSAAIPSKYELILYENFGFSNKSLITETEKTSGDAIMRTITFDGVSNDSSLKGSVSYGVGGTYKELDLDKYPQKIEIAEKDGKNCVKFTLPHKGLQPILSVPIVKFDDEHTVKDSYKFVMNVYHPEMEEVTDPEKIDINAAIPKVYGKPEIAVYVRYFDENGTKISDSTRAYIADMDSWQTISIDVTAIPDNACYMKPIIYMSSLCATSGTYVAEPAFYKYNENAVEKATINKSIILKLGSSDAYVNLFRYKIDKNNLNVVPFTENGRTLVPVRFISESLGAEVGWDDSTQTVTIKYDDSEILIKIGENKMTVNKVEKMLDVPAKTYEGRTMLPLRAVVEALGKTVHWDDRGIIVITNDKVIEENDETVDKILAYCN